MTSSYWDDRKGMMYYQYIREIVRVLAVDATSMLDVGSHDAQYMEWFDWVSERQSIDIRQPYSSTAVAGIQADFFEFQPERKFDFVLCLQVLEHIEDATRFAHRLFDVADRVLISVPHKWPPGACVSHVHDPVDAEKVRTWMGRRPDYEILVTEPMRKPRTAGRLIQYYGPVGERFNISAAREHAIAIWNQRHKDADGEGDRAHEGWPLTVGNSS